VALKEVVSFRMEKSSIKAARRRAKQRRIKFTRYFEDLVMNDLRQQSAPSRPQSPTLARVVRLLRDHSQELADLGVRHAKIFGSVARGEDRPDSDIDILVEVDPKVVDDLFAYSRIRRTLEQLIGRPVDIARHDRLRPAVAEEVEKDNIYAF